MTTLYSILLAIDVLLAIGIIALVLLQHGKGADAGAAFGSGASATVFGARGSTSFLSRATGVLAALFFLNSMSLAYLASHQPTDQSVVESIKTDYDTASSADDTTSPPLDVPAAPVDVPEGGAQTTDTPGQEDGTDPKYEDVPMGGDVVQEQKSDDKSDATGADGPPQDVR